MSKLYLEAIRALPEEWIDDKTQVVASAFGAAVVHPDRKPMMYVVSGLEWRWQEIELAYDLATEPVTPVKEPRPYFRLKDFENG